jgi:transcriptional regulator with XRE-family HTH domain
VKSVFTEQYQELLKALIEARKSASVTQQDLANRLGKPQSFVSKYEHGERRLDVIEFLVIAHVIGVNPYSLLRAIDLKFSDKHSSETQWK